MVDDITTFGPLKTELVNSESFNFYRFLYRKDRKENDDNIELGDETYTITVDNVVMKHVDLDGKIFNNYAALHDYLSNITSVETNVTPLIIANLYNNIKNNFVNNNKYSKLEVILPVIDNNEYNQNDINEIYNVIIKAIKINH